MSKELQTLWQSAKPSLEPYVNAESLHEGLEESDVPATLTHLTDVYLQGWVYIPLRLVPSQPASGAESHLSGTAVCLPELPQLTLPIFDGLLQIFDSDS